MWTICSARTIPPMTDRPEARRQYARTSGEDYFAELHLNLEEAARGGMFQLALRPAEPCGYCLGTGWRQNMRACSKCEGGTVPAIGPWGIPVPPGVTDGQVLIAPGEGAKGRGYGAAPGDLRITCRVPGVFRSSGADQTVDVGVGEPVLREGGKVRVPLPGDGKGAVNMTVPPGCMPGQKLRLRGKAQGGGDLYVRLQRQKAPIQVQARRVGVGG